MAADAATAAEPALEAIFEFAAFSGAFDPALALTSLGATDRGQMAALASRLALSCDTHPPGREGQWVMLTPERRKVFRRVAAAGRIAAAVASRRRVAVDGCTGSLLAALEGSGPFAPEAAEALALAAAPERSRVEDMIVALDRAGELAPAYDALPLLRSALARLDQQKRLEDLEKRGLVLRERDRATVDAWLARRFTDPPVQVLYAAGPPGIGKSVLLETSVLAASAETPNILVRLDFDRPGLDILDEVGLTAEVARQVANEAGLSGRALLAERLRAASLAGGGAESGSMQRRFFPHELAAAIGRTVAETGREVLVVIDTLEALRARGDTHPGLLFEWLDRLVKAGLQPVRVLAAGRDDSLPLRDGEPDRVGAQINVEAMDEQGTEALMDKLGVAPALRPALARLAEGNPLILRVAASVAREGSAGAMAGRQEREVAHAFLNRVLLSRIDDPRLKSLLTPGLIVASIDREVLRDVIAPALRIRLTEQEAEQLLEALSQQSWLVEPDPYAPGSVRMRRAIRSVVLRLLYETMRGACVRLDEKAARFFARRAGPRAQGLAVYHRLQMMRAGRPVPGISPQMALAVEDEMMEDLPPAAQDVVRSLRGDRTSQLRSGGGVGPVAADDDMIARELMGITERQDWNEGRYAVEQLTGGCAIDPRSRAADALVAFWWRSGRWERAREWMRDRERFTAAEDASDLRELPPALALVRLEMEAEFVPQRLRRRMAAEPELAGTAAELALRSSDDVGRSGALAFVAAAASGGAFPASISKGDIAGAAFALHGHRDRPGGEDEVRRATAEAHERLQARSTRPFKADFSPLSVARLLAVLTPYATMALNLAVQRGFEWLEGWAAASDAKLSAAGALLPWSFDLDPQRRDHPVLAIARLGLFAEWAQAAGRLQRCPDLRLIGRSAENWRRTVAGHWGYGARPAGWRHRVMDITVEDRLRTLWVAGNDDQAAIEQLGLWSGAPENDGERVWNMIGGRISVRPGEGPAETMRRLLAGGMPSSFAPAAATLAITRAKAGPD